MCGIPSARVRQILNETDVLADCMEMYREYAPPAQARESLACLWTRVVPPGGGAIRVMPDACSDLIWRAGHGAFVAGPDTEAWLSSAPAGSVIVGARFRPGVGGPALGLPLSELLNLRVDLGELNPRLDEQLAPDLTADAALERVAAAASQLAQSPDPAMRAAVRRLADPRARVERLADELGFSERQLRRRCHAAVGYGPKTLQRVLRFRRFLARADAGDDLARAALDAGYADQAHLTRDCTRLSGLTPSRLALERTG
jgi:AraC-like DNA-binding protein